MVKQEHNNNEESEDHPHPGKFQAFYLFHNEVHSRGKHSKFTIHILYIHLLKS